tara:strand:+ start:600 stop:791 length:192 start_codon:yes stop_codon:yes gene_type:complete
MANFDNFEDFSKLSLPQQLIVVKEIAKVFTVSNDPYLLDQLITFVNQMEVPEIINMNEIMGEA